jgi:hypothetical protein
MMAELSPTAAATLRLMRKARYITVASAVLAVVAGLLPVGCRKGPVAIQTQPNTLSIIQTALDVYYVDVGEYPPSLTALIHNPGNPNWRGPYCAGKSVPTDRWGMPLQYNAMTNSFVLRSAGPDRVIGTADDITLAQTNNVPPDPTLRR